MRERGGGRLFEGSAYLLFWPRGWALIRARAVIRAWALIRGNTVIIFASKTTVRPPKIFSLANFITSGIHKLVLANSNWCVNDPTCWQTIGDK